MLSFLVKGSLHCLLLAAMLYGIFFLPLGERSLYEHGARIAATDPAQELGSEVSGAIGQAGVAVRNRLADDGTSPGASGD